MMHLRIFVFVDDPMHFIQIRLVYGEAFGFGLRLDNFRSSRCHNVRLSGEKC